jgi:hypothetical protein
VGHYLVVPGWDIEMALLQCGRAEEHGLVLLLYILLQNESETLARLPFQIFLKYAMVEPPRFLLQ